uniref:BHLH domain-containing protein n=1 Tax=Panagrolaimus sp. ES5 TaxID=591445 RepID=A0AC34GTX2_9BILA
MQSSTQQQPEIFSAFHYGSVLQSTINAANLLRAQTNTVSYSPDQNQQHQLIENNNAFKKDKKISPFDHEAIVPLPFQLTDYKARSVGTTVWKRNERERYRVRCVNEAYENLRDCLPFDGDEKRLSKV